MTIEEIFPEIHRVFTNPFEPEPQNKATIRVTLNLILYAAVRAVCDKHPELERKISVHMKTR